MRTIRFLLQKEFRQIFRNKIILAMIVVMPAIQLMILPLAADYEIKNINIAIVDHDRSPYSQELISSITASGYFRLTGYNDSFQQAFRLIERDRADLILEIPHGFEKNLIREGEQKMFIAVNAINGVKANLGGAYLTSIIKNYNKEIRLDLNPATRFEQSPLIEVTSSNWFNSLLNYRVFMVPGILAFLVTLVGGFLTCLNIVKEKEVGTIEQINVTPIKKTSFHLRQINSVLDIGKCSLLYRIAYLLVNLRYCAHREPAGFVWFRWDLPFKCLRVWTSRFNL